LGHDKALKRRAKLRSPLRGCKTAALLFHDYLRFNHFDSLFNARGEAPDEARVNALREFGNVGLVKEVTRETWGWAWLERLGQDLRFGARMLRKQPGFTLIAALLLALGIGANTALFSVVDAVLLKMLPVKAPERLVLLSHTGGGARGESFSHGSYEHIRDHDRTLAGVLAYYPLRLTVSVDGQPEPATTGQLVTGSYFAVLGVNAAAGRTIAPEDDRTPGAHPVCVISDGYWQRRFGRAPSVVGKTLHLSGFPFTVIGVTPPEFFGAEVGAAMDISVPLAMREQVMPGMRPLLNDARNLFRIMFGLAPAFAATRVELQFALKQDAPEMTRRGARRSFGQVFVIAQVALSLLLLIGAGLFVRSLQKLQQAPTGFERENALALKIEPAGSDSKWRARSRLTTFYDELLRRVESLPGVRSASLVAYSPMSPREWLALGDGPDARSSVTVPGYTPLPGEEEYTHWMQVYPGSFESLGIPLVAGRDFSPRDDQQAPRVAVINESMARHFFGNENPIGRRFGLPNGEVEIIGVAKDAKYRSLREQGRPMFYLPFAQPGSDRAQMTLVARATGDPVSLAAALQREARALDPAMPMFQAETLAEQLDASLAQERLVATLSSGFGLLALLLACIGLYGVMAYDVARRTREIGIRMALGAQTGAALRLALKQGMRLALLGVALGLAAAAALTRWVASLLFGVSATDPLTFGGSAVVLLFVALLACWIPARRAAKVDPLVALRAE